MAKKKIIMNNTPSMYVEQLNQMKKEKDLKRRLSSAKPDISPETIQTLLDVEKRIERLRHSSTVMYNTATSLTTSDKFEKRSKFKTQEVSEEMGKKLYQGLYEPLMALTPDVFTLKKAQQGSELLTNAILYDDLVYQYTKENATQNLSRVEKVLDRIKKDKRILVHDTETLGGINSYGRRELDTLTEFYAGIMAQGPDGNIKVEKEFNVLIGLAPEKEKEYNDIIEKYLKSGKLDSQREEVIIKRLGLYGHDATTYEIDGRGNYAVKTFSDSSRVFNENELRRGLRELRKAWDVNNSASQLGADGLYDWQAQFADYIKLLQDSSIVKVDQNGGMADFPWINTYLQNNMFENEAFMKRAGLNASRAINVDTESYLDVLGLLRESLSGTDASKVYDTPQKQILRAKSRKGINALENIASAALDPSELISSLAPHTAKFDGIQTGRLIFEQQEKYNQKSFSEFVLDMAKNKASTLKGALKNNNQQLFFATETMRSGAGSKGALSFIADNLNKSMRFSTGLNIEENSVRQDSWQQFPIRKGSFYTLDWAGEFDTTSIWTEEVAALFPEYKAGKIYAARLNPVYDETIASADVKASSPHFIVAESKQELEAILSKSALVGEREQGQKKWTPIQGTEKEVEELLSVSRLNKGGKYVKVESKDPIKEAIRVATIVENNDKAARTAREYNYKNFDRHKKFKELMESINGKNVTKKEVNTIVAKLLGGQELQVATQVAEGHTVGINDVIQAVGFKDYKTKEYRAYSETLNRAINSYDYYESVMPIVDEILNQLDPNDPNLDYKFSYTMNEYMNKVAVELHQKDPRSFYANSAGQRIFTSDTNRFIINDLEYDDGKKSRKHISSLLSIQNESEIAINLNDKSGQGLINTLLRKQNIDIKSIPSGSRVEQELTVLKQFVRKLKDNRYYSEIFDENNGGDLSESKDPILFARDILDRLKTARANNPALGRSQKEYIFDATNPHAIRSTAYATDPTLIKETVSNILTNIPRRVVLKSSDEAGFIEQAEKLVGLRNHHLFRSLSFNGKQYSDIDPMLNDMGLPDFYKKHYRTMYNQVQNEYRDFMAGFLKTLGRVENGQVVYSQEGIKFISSEGEYDINRLPILSFEDGIFGAKVGGVRVAVHNTLDTSKAINRQGVLDAKNVKVTTNLKQAFDKINFNYVEEYLNSGKSIMDWIASVESRLYESLTEGSPGYSTSDLTEVEKSMHFLDENLKQILPVMKEQGMLEGYDKRFLDKIKSGADYLDGDFMDSEFKQLYQQYRPQLLKTLNDYGATDLDPIIGNLSTDVKAGAIDRFLKIGTAITNPLIQLQDSRRDVPMQERSIPIRRNEALAKAKELGVDQQIDLESIVTTRAAKKARNRNFRGIIDTTVDISMKNLNISDPMLKELLSLERRNRQFQESLGISGAELYDRILDKLSSANLFEGSAILDSRVADAAFDYTDVQRINLNKLQLITKEDYNTFKNLQNFSEILPSFEIVDGQMQATLSKGISISRNDYIPTEGPNGTITPVLANHDGNLNIGFYLDNSNIRVKEEELNKIISSARTEEEVSKILERHGIQPYVEISYNDMPELIKTIQDGGEKNTAYIPRMGVGEVDERMRAYLQESHKNGLNKNIRVGQVINFNNRKNELQFDEAIAQSVTIGSEEEFWEIFNKERHSASLVLSNLVSEHLGVEGISMFSANGPISHGNTGSILRENINAMVNAQMQLGLSKKEAASYVVNELNQANVFEGFSVYAEDGQIFFPERLTAGAQINIQKMMDVIQNDAIYHNVDGKVFYNGDHVASVTHLSVTQVQDYQNVTGREIGNKRIEEKRKEINKLRAEMNLEEDETIKKVKKKQIRALKEDIRLIEQGIENADKGTKIGDREMLMLSHEKYSQEWLDELQDSVGNDSLFEQMSHDILQTEGNAYLKTDDGRYKIKESLIGTSVNAPFIEERHKYYYLGDSNDKTLKASREKDFIKYTDDNVREGIKRIVKKSEYKELRQDLAEMSYSMYQGFRAEEFRNNQLDLDDMKKLGFNKIDINDFSPYIKNTFEEAIDNESSLIGKNLLLDLGEEFGDASNPSRYVAVPYVPVKRLGEDIIRRDYEKAVNKVSRSIERLNTYGTTNYSANKSIEELKADVRNSVQEYYEKLKFTMTSKEGFFGEASSYRIAGVNTKTASGVPYVPTEKTGQKIFDNWLEKIQDGNLDMEEINFKGLSTAKVGDKSILEHAKEGRFFNAEYNSLETIEKMGLLNDSVLEQFGKTREEMLDHLATEGIYGEIRRSPVIKTGSTVRGKIYYSDQLTGTRKVIVSHTQVGMTGDNDGDVSSSNVITYKKPITDENGEVTYKDSFLVDKDNLSTDEKSFWSSVERSMYHDAGTANQYWATQVQNTIVKEMKNTKKGSSMEALIENIKSGVLLPELSALDEGKEAIKQLDTFKELEGRLQSDGWDFKNNTLEELDDWLVKNAGEDADRFRESFIFNLKYNKAQETGLAKMLRSAIGEVNTPMFKARKTLELSMLHNTIEDVQTRHIVQKAFENFEQDVISYKKVDSLVGSSSRVVEFEKAFYQLTSGNKKSVQEGRENMSKWIDAYASSAPEDIAIELSANHHQFKEFANVDWSDIDTALEQGKITEDYYASVKAQRAEVSAKVKERILDGIASIQNNRIETVREAQKLGTAVNIASSNRIDVSKVLRYEVQKTGATLSENTLELIQSAGEGEYAPKPVTVEKQHYFNSKEMFDDKKIDDGLNRARQSDTQTVKSILGEAGEKVGRYVDDAIKNMSHSKFSKGALAFGAMFMMTGYLGNKVTEPAMEQAPNRAAEEGAPRLSDFQQPMTTSYPQQTNKGYVINIKGRGTPQAVQQSLGQIQRSAHQSFATDVNVSMNITEQPSNIDDRAIEQMISDAIG